MIKGQRHQPYRSTFVPVSDARIIGIQSREISGWWTAAYQNSEHHCTIQQN